MKSKLIAARELISTPGTWTRGAAARDADGNPVIAPDSRAVSFCAIGACNRVGIPSWPLHDHLPAGINLAKFNDRATHAQVLALFDKAIAA